MKELLIPAISELVDHHCQHLGHRVIHTLHSTITIWVVGAGGNFLNPKGLVWSESMLRGHPQRGMYRLRMLAVPSAVSSAAVTALSLIHI